MFLHDGEQLFLRHCETTFLCANGRFYFSLRAGGLGYPWPYLCTSNRYGDGGELAEKKVKTAKLQMSLGPRGRSWRAGDALHGQKNVMRREKLGGRQSVLQLLCTPQHQKLGC